MVRVVVAVGVKVAVAVVLLSRPTGQRSLAVTVQEFQVQIRNTVLWKLKQDLGSIVSLDELLHKKWRQKLVLAI